MSDQTRHVEGLRDTFKRASEGAAIPSAPETVETLIQSTHSLVSAVGSEVDLLEGLYRSITGESIPSPVPPEMDEDVDQCLFAQVCRARNGLEKQQIRLTTVRTILIERLVNMV